MASGQSGRDVTERDVQRFIVEIGGQVADPRAFERVAQDVTNRIVRNFTNRYETVTRTPYTGDFGTQSLFPQGAGADELTPAERAELQMRLGLQNGSQ